jgi:hypothetical protein
VHFLSLQKPDATFFAVEGTEQLHVAEGAMTMTITYDDRDLPTEVLFHDARHILLRQVIFVRDSAGRLLSEEIQLRGQIPFPDLEKQLESSPPEERERAIVTFASLFGPTQTFSKTTYTYDQTGRRFEQSISLGGVAEERTIYRYDDHDNPIEQTNENRSREANLGEDGTLHYSADQLVIHHTRFEYRYDAQGNWTERIASTRLEPNPDFQRSNIECRVITYYAA